MTRRRPQQRDPLEAAIEAALQPGRFIAYRAGWDFVSSLEEVAAQLEKLIRTGSERAVGLYETFLAGCYQKAEELDDSSGDFGMLVVSLYCGWIKARQAAGSDADETPRLLLDRTLDVLRMRLPPSLPLHHLRLVVGAELAAALSPLAQPPDEGADAGLWYQESRGERVRPHLGQLLAVLGPADQPAALAIDEHVAVPVRAREHPPARDVILVHDDRRGRTLCRSGTGRRCSRRATSR